jgi:hypothetical protein
MIIKLNLNLPVKVFAKAFMFKRYVIRSSVSNNYILCIFLSKTEIT